jgi:hypothetical protein
MSAADNFRAASLSGRITITGNDGRTCEVDIAEIQLDTHHPDGPVSYEVGHEPIYGGDSWFPKLVANPVTLLGAKIRLRHSEQPEPLFTMTFREAPELPQHCEHDELGHCIVKSHYEKRA